MTRKPTHTPPRSVRVEEGLWQAARSIAAARGESVASVLVKALERYVRRYGEKDTK